MSDKAKETDEDEIEKPEKEESSEQKAEAIGKQLDAAKEEETVPDYDITEEGEPDERLGKTREMQEHRDHRTMSNREKRQLRKKKLLNKLDTKDALIRQQQDELARLAARVNDMDAKVSTVDRESLVRQYNDAVSAFRNAEMLHQNAFAKQDGATATKAMREMYVAQKAIDELEQLNARMQAQPQQRQAPQADPVEVNKAKSWASKNPWFDAAEGNEDSAVANAVAKQLVKEGYRGNSDEFWDTLDDRLAARGIGSEADDDEDDAPPPKPVRRTPPVSGSSGRGDLGAGKTAITLPTEFVKTLKENGYWDDPKVRNRMIKRHLDVLKERQTA